MDNHSSSMTARRSPVSRLLLPVQGEVLASDGEPSDVSSSVASLFRKYALISKFTNSTSSVREIQAMSLKRRNMRESQARQEDSELFMELIYDIQHELNVEQLCFKILHNIAVITDCDRSSLFLTRNDDDESVLVCKLFDLTSGSQYEDVCKSEEETFIIPFGKGVLGHVAESKQFVKIDNAYEVSTVELT